MADPRFHLPKGLFVRALFIHPSFSHMVNSVTYPSTLLNLRLTFHSIYMKLFTIHIVPPNTQHLNYWPVAVTLDVVPWAKVNK